MRVVGFLVLVPVNVLDEVEKCTQGDLPSTPRRHHCGNIVTIDPSVESGLADTQPARGHGPRHRPADPAFEIGANHCEVAGRRGHPFGPSQPHDVIYQLLFLRHNRHIGSVPRV